MTEPAAVPVPWLAALLFRWPRGSSLAPSELETLAGELRGVRVDLRVLGAPRDGDPAPAVTSRMVADELDGLDRRGVGAGLVGAIGQLPGLPPRVVRLPGGVRSLRAVAGTQIAYRAERRVPAVDLDPEWTLPLPGADPLRRRIEESLGTVADGRVGTRGAVEEDGPGTDPLVVVGGAYTRGHGGGALEATPTLLEGPLWAQLAVGARAATGLGRVLDLRTGVLARGATGDSLVRSVRFACLARPGTCVLRAEGGTDDVAPGATLTAPEGQVRLRRDGPDWWAVAGSRRSWITAAARTDEALDEDAGRRVVERRAVYATGRGALPMPGESSRAMEEATADTLEELLEEQRAAWAQRWRRADVVIDGDPQMQLAVRFCLFHLMASVPDAGEAAVGARGLSGVAYRGHVFWDADVFVLPFLAATHPPAARAMLAYRHARLPAACAAAARMGLRGARFPWESADDGSDVTPTSTLGSNGRLLRVLTGRYQEHITADVAWAVAHYLDWTGDRAYGLDRGRRLLVETARYWRARATHDDGRAHLRQVIGPDEYHGPVDDNAFTNGMARWNLRRAAALAGRSESTDLRREAATWRRLAAGLVDGYDPRSGRHEQFTGYSELEPLLATDVAPPPMAADLLLGQETVAATQVIKQADVLMLHHLLPWACPSGSLSRDLAHYLPRTAHGSSLSPGVHACLLARAGRPDEAVDLLALAARVDLDDVTGTTAGGLHLAAAGSVWQALAYGFVGLWPGPRATLIVAPQLPSRWEAVTVHVTFRGQALQVRAEHDRVRVRCAQPVVLLLGGRPRIAEPPESAFRRDAAGWRPSPR